MNYTEKRYNENLINHISLKSSYVPALYNLILLLMYQNGLTAVINPEYSNASSIIELTKDYSPIPALILNFLTLVSIFCIFTILLPQLQNFRRFITKIISFNIVLMLLFQVMIITVVGGGTYNSIAFFNILLAVQIFGIVLRKQLYLQLSNNDY